MLSSEDKEVVIGQMKMSVKLKYPKEVSLADRFGVFNPNKMSEFQTAGVIS